MQVKLPGTRLVACGLPSWSSMGATRTPCCKALDSRLHSAQLLHRGLEHEAIQARSSEQQRAARAGRLPRLQSLLGAVGGSWVMNGRVEPLPLFTSNTGTPRLRVRLNDTCTATVRRGHPPQSRTKCLEKRTPRLSGASTFTRRVDTATSHSDYLPSLVALGHGTTT